MPAVGQVNVEWLKRLGAVQFSQLLDGHNVIVCSGRRRANQADFVPASAAV
jgi:hypothetical protein